MKEKKQKKKRGTQKKYKNNQEISNKMAISTYLSIITLITNGLNAIIKRHSVWDFSGGPVVKNLPSKVET